MLDGVNYSIEIGEDPLKINRENNMSRSLSSFDGFSTPPQIASSSTLSSLESSNSVVANSESCKRKERRFSLLNPLTWFRSEQIIVDDEKDESELTASEDWLLIDKIMAHFRNNENDELFKILESDKMSEKLRMSVDYDVIESDRNSSFVFADEYIEDSCFVMIDPVSPSPVPPILAKKNPIQSRVVKSVRFEMDYTPEQLPKRPFTPLFTSTPRTEDVDEDDSDEDCCVPLTQCDSNTVVAPDLSSILTRNDSIMSAINKSRQQTVDLALDHDRARSYYKVYYDDTDEEEVIDDETRNDNQTTFPISGPTVLECGVTHVVSPIDCSTAQSTVSDKHDFLTFNVEPKSSHDYSEDEINSSINSSVYFGIERIDEYLKTLESEIIVMRKVAHDNEDVQSADAWRRVEVLEEQILRIHQTVIDLKTKLGDDKSSAEESFVDVKSSVFHGSLALESNVFDESNWAQFHEQNEFGGSSCDSSELVPVDDYNSDHSVIDVNIV